MNVLHVIDSLDPKLGGPPMVASRLAAAQAPLVERASILTYEPNAETADRVAQALEGMPGGDAIERPTCAASGLFERVKAPAMARRAAELLDENSFVHFHSVWSPVTHSIAKLCHARDIPYTVCVHGMLDDWCMQQKPLKKKTALALGMAGTFRRAAFMHMLNQYESDTVTRFGFGSPNEIIPNGVFPEEFQDLPERTAFHAKRPELEGKPYVLFLSRLHYKKGLDYLAEGFAVALQKNPELRLVVAGPDGGAEPQLREDLKRLRIEHAAHVVGPLYGSDKMDALVGAACFCLPSRQEGFSIAITEALASSVPCVVSEDCHYPEVAEAGAGRVVPLNAEQIGEAIAEVVSDETERAAMGRRGHELVFERFTWPMIAKQTVDLYREYLDARRNNTGKRSAP